MYTPQKQYLLKPQRVKQNSIGHCGFHLDFPTSRRKPHLFCIPFATPKRARRPVNRKKSAIRVHSLKMLLKGTRDELGCVVIKTGIVETLHAIERNCFCMFIWLTADILPGSSEPIMTTKNT